MIDVYFSGPHKFSGTNSIFDEISRKEDINKTACKNYIYLWCIKTDADIFKVYYVGETSNIKQRMNSHYRNQIGGKYTGHCIDGLKDNKLILRHRGGVGLVPNYTEMNVTDYNVYMADNLHLFYAEILSEGNAKEDKSLRCRYETGIVWHIQNQGVNIVCVGNLRLLEKNKEKFIVNSGNNKIESLSDQIIEF